MEILQQKVIENLVKDGVIIATQEYLLREGSERQPIGDIKRESYGNWEEDRKRLIASEPEDVVNAVMAIWGDSPTVFLDEQEDESVMLF